MLNLITLAVRRLTYLLHHKPNLEIVAAFSAVQDEIYQSYV